MWNDSTPGVRYGLCSCKTGVAGDVVWSSTELVRCTSGHRRECYDITVGSLVRRMSYLANMWRQRRRTTVLKSLPQLL